MTDKLYIEKVNSVIDYIKNNLDQNLTLNDIAKTAGLSKFHIHRTFHAFTGESLYEMIVKLRIEKAAERLLTEPSATIVGIAGDAGFENSADFSAAFKKRFDISPSAWRKKKNKSKTTDTDSPLIKQPEEAGPEALSTEIKKLNGLSIAYIKHNEVYAGDSSLFIYLYNKLTAWAASEDLLKPECENIVVYHDPIEITDDDRLKISLGISVPENTKTAGDIEKMKLQGGDYLVCRYRLRDEEYGEAWQQVYRQHLPELGLQPADGQSFELYPNKVENPDKYSTIVDICVPVTKLSE
jgi:AraC family transcriptional regulator